MKHILAVSAAIFVIILLAACAAQSTITPTIAPTATATAVPAVSSTPAPTATFAPTIKPSPTSAVWVAPTQLPNPTSVVETVQDCITIENELPADLKLDGALVLSDDRRRLSLYHLDFMSQRKSPFPDAVFSYYSNGEYASLSPDGEWMAYFELEYDEEGRQRDRILQVANAEGSHLDMTYWTLNWQNLIGWLDNEHLLLAVEDYPGGDYIVLNPFTTEYEVLDIRLKDLLSSFEWFLWHHDLEEAVPDLSLDYWVTAVEKDNHRVWELIQLEGKETLWTGQYRYYNRPMWSPDGQYFSIMENFSCFSDCDGKWKLVRVGLDGSVLDLSDQIGEPNPEMSWSPDSRFLAGWVNLDPNTEFYDTPQQLVLVDVQKPSFTDLCIQSEWGWYDNHSPVWSPDGQHLAIAVSRTEEEQRWGYTYEYTVWDTAIIDLQTHRGFLLTENAAPQAWMRKP